MKTIITARRSNGETVCYWNHFGGDNMTLAFENATDVGRRGPVVMARLKETWKGLSHWRIERIPENL